MAIALQNKPNVQAPGGAYPYGKIKDNPGNGTGTPVNEVVYGDFHQFFAKMMAEAGITYNNVPDNATDGFQYFLALLKNINKNPSSGVVETNAQKTVKTKVLEIGDWNMNTTQTKQVPHGLTFSKIRSFSAVIRRDGTGELHDLRIHSINFGLSGYINITDTNIVLNREADGAFNNNAYEAIPYNRGFITILYED